MKEPKPIMDASALEPEKGGLVIYGRNAQGQLCVLTSFVQGRFNANPDDKLKYYGFAKGTLDKILVEARDGNKRKTIKESGLDGAIRETAEETGLDMHDLFGHTNLMRYKAGETIENEPSPLDSRVKIKHACVQNEADYAYISGTGAQRRLQLYYIEVEGIEHLAGHLKNLEGDPHNPEKSVTDTGITELLRAKGYPSFKEMQDILRTGKIKKDPSKLWAPANVTLFEKPAFPGIESRMRSKKYKNGALNAQTPEDWITFCEEIPGGDFKALKPQFTAIKKYFEGLGLVGDRMGIKLDDKVCPLCFYQEGGEILPFETLVMRALRTAEQNQKYAQGMWGTYDGPRIAAREGAEAQFPHGQISGFARMFERLDDEFGVLKTIQKVAGLWKRERQTKHPDTIARAEAFATYPERIKQARAQQVEAQTAR